MEHKNWEIISQQTKETTLDKIRKQTIAKYVASILSLASFWTTLWLSSCNNNHEKLEQELTIDIMAKNHKVDISWWNKILSIEWNSLKIWNETVAKWNKECQVRIGYENSQVVNPEPLIWNFLEKPWKIIIHLLPFDVTETKDLCDIKGTKDLYDYGKTDYLILYTNQETLITWLNSLKNIPFKVGESINLMNYINLNNVYLEKITITYPNKKEPTDIDNPYNFIPEHQWQWLDLKIYVNKKWKTYKCVTEINIFPKKRESIWPTIEPSNSEDIPPISNIDESNKKFYQHFQDSKAIIWRQMIQAMSHHGTSILSSKEYKNHLNKIAYIIIWKKTNWNHEITDEWENKTINEHTTANDKIIKTWMPNSKIIIEENDNSLQSKIIKYTQSHPEEFIIIYNSSNNDENNEINHKTQINDFQWLNNVINIEWINDSDLINSILLWMTMQLNPKIKSTDDLLQNLHYSTARNNTTNNWEQENSFQMVDLWWAINKILPEKLSLSIDFSSRETWKYELIKKEYPFIIFDIPWSMMKINEEWIPCNKENWYLLKNTNIASYERCIDKEELIKLWYKSWDNIKWNVIVLDENWKKLNINVPIVFQLKWL